MLSSATYLFGDFICFLVVFVIAQKSSKQFKILIDERFFFEVVLAAIILIISDVISYTVNGVQMPGFKLINIISSGVYLFQLGFICAVWLVYVDYKLNRQTKRAFKARVVSYSLPTVILFALLLTSQKTQFLYFVDSENNYHRGNGFIFHIIFALVYMVYSAGISLKEAKKEKNRQLRHEKRALASFSIATFMCGLIQIVVPDISLTTVGITISLLIVYLNVQTKQIFVDTLTGINNRRQLNIYIESILEHKKNNYFYLMMIDVDRFKQINDNFGHVEGDLALVKVSEILSKACDKNNDFVARFGGDEFAIVSLRKTEAEIEALKLDIHYLIDVENLSSGKEYDLSLSIGSAKIYVDSDNIESSIRKADEQLYLIKQRKKAGEKV